MTDLPANQSQEGNFLDLLRNKLDQMNLLAAVKDQKIKTLVEETVPAWIQEFAGYIGSVETPALHEPQDYTKAQDAQATMQRQLDRLTRCYVDHLLTYQGLQKAKSLASYYVQIEVNEVKALKNADQRAAAVNYVLDDFTEALGALDQLYDVIAQLRMHIEKANLGINLQMKLVEGKASLKHGSNRVL